MEQDADYARRTERIKNLLSSYYGGDGQPGSPGSPSSSAATGPGAPAGQPSGHAPGPAGRLPAPTATLDSPACNADRYIAHVLKTYSLDKLLTEHRGMAREIKNLDSDMQQLVCSCACPGHTVHACLPPLACSPAPARLSMPPVGVGGTVQVYENYNKFITATDTIRTMKANVDGMGTEMDKLKGIMGA